MIPDGRRVIATYTVAFDDSGNVSTFSQQHKDHPDSPPNELAQIQIVDLITQTHQSSIKENA